MSTRLRPLRFALAVFTALVAGALAAPAADNVCAGLLAKLAGDPKAAKDKSGLSEQDRELLTRTAKLAADREGLDWLVQLSAAKQLPPPVDLRRWAPTVPESARPAVEGLATLTELQSIASRPWNKPPDVTQIDKLLTDLQKTSGDADLVRQISADLAGKAFLDNHPKAARELLPRDLDAPTAAAQLREIEMVLTGAPGARTTWAAASAGIPEPGTSNRNPRGPPAQALVPIGDPAGTRTPITGKATKGFPEVTDPPAAPPELAPGLGARYRNQIKEETAKSQKTWEAENADFRKALADARVKLPRRPVNPNPGTNPNTNPGTGGNQPNDPKQPNAQPDDDDEKYIAEVEKFLAALETSVGGKDREKRKLTADERFVAILYRKFGMSAADTARTLWYARVAAE